MKRIVENFMSYVKIHTTSKDEAQQVPSTPGQWDLARKLEAELKALGVENAYVDENCFVIGRLASNLEKKVPTIAFFAHLDTAPNEVGENVKPQLVENYQGGEIVLNSQLDIRMSPQRFPVLNEYVGKTLITTDGTTLLGADDKAGIAIIMEMVHKLKENPAHPHGDIIVCFTPDEEVSPGGAELFAVETLGADFAYTVDGDGSNEFNRETFNAAGAVVHVTGADIHPGEGKDKMVNASLLAAEFISLLPKEETPAHTQEREGFYHLCDMKGDVAEARLEYILRDFDLDVLQQRKAAMLEAAEQVNKKYGQERITVKLVDQYYNMGEYLNDCPQVIDLAMRAYRDCGVEPDVRPIRGGTDGARFSRKGLPTPNIFAAGHNYHSKYEFACVEAMESATAILLRIVELNAE